jgi:putative serine protease PepD
VSDDEGAPPDPGFRGAPLPPEDRLWRHPSEVARPPAGRPRRGRGAAALVLAAGVGATLALVAAWGLGAFEDPVATETASERMATPAATVFVGTATTNDIDDLAAALVMVRVGGAVGSGVVLRDDGHVLTTADLIGDSTEITVQPVDGPPLEADVVGTDPATDVAVLLVRGLNRVGAVLGEAGDIAVGDPTRAITLRGEDAAEVLSGVVANLAVTVTRADDRPLHGLIGTDIVQDQPVEGAALVDAQGAVIGVTTGVGDTDVVRAVPMDLARIVAADIIATGAADHPWLGIEGRDLEVDVAADWGVRGGAELAAVVDDGPAAAAGLLADDVVTQVGDLEITSMGDLVTALRHRDPGDLVRIGYLRAGEHHWCRARLAATT